MMPCHNKTTASQTLFLRSVQRDVSTPRTDSGEKRQRQRYGIHSPLQHRYFYKEVDRRALLPNKHIHLVTSVKREERIRVRYRISYIPVC